MLNLLKNIWHNPSDQQQIDSLKVRRDQMARLQDEYTNKREASIVSHPDYVELQETIYEKERQVLQHLNALEILYKAKTVTKENLIEEYTKDTPFEFQKEYEELFATTKAQYGYTGPTGNQGNPGPIGQHYNYPNTNPLFVSNPSKHITLIDNSGNLIKPNQFTNPICPPNKKLP